MQMRTMVWWLGVVVTLVSALGCDGGRTGPGTGGNQPVSKAAGFSFKSPAIIVTPGGNPSSMVAEVTITNKTDHAITQAYVSVSGEVVATGALIISPDNRIQPGESNWQKIGIGVSAGKGNGVTAVLVAVVLEDGTVFGDGGVVHDMSRMMETSTVTPEDIEAATLEVLLALSPEVIAGLSPAVREDFDRRVEGEAPERAALLFESADALRAPVVTAAWNGLVYDPATAEVVRAVYGAGESWADVTGHFVEVAGDSRHECRVGARHYSMDYDPVPGVPKMLAVTLAIDGREVTLTEADSQLFSVGAPWPGDEAVGATAQPLEIGDMRVLAAWYGRDWHWVDVLGMLRTVAGRGDGRINAVDGAELAGDNKGKAYGKQLRLYYEQGGERRIAVIEDTTKRIVLPFGSPAPVEVAEVPPPREAPPVPLVDESRLLPVVRPMMVVEASDVAVFGPGDLELVRAEYTAGRYSEDLTEALVTKLGAPDGLYGLTGRHDTLGIAKPALAVSESLKLTCRVGEVEIEVRADGDTELVIGAPGQFAGCVGTTATPIELGDMRIVAAWYGAGNGWCDVLPQLRGKVVRGTVQTRAGLDLAQRDPKRSIEKQLRLYFERGGELWVAVYLEGADLVLPFEA